MFSLNMAVICFVASLIQGKFKSILKFGGRYDCILDIKSDSRLTTALVLSMIIVKALYMKR